MVVELDKLYFGRRMDDGEVRVFAGNRRLLRRQEVIDFSLGFDWGAHNNAAYQLAVAILMDVLKDPSRVRRLYKAFAIGTVYRWDRQSWQIRRSQVLNIVAALEAAVVTVEGDRPDESRRLSCGQAWSFRASNGSPFQSGGTRIIH